MQNEAIPLIQICFLAVSDDEDIGSKSATFDSQL